METEEESKESSISMVEAKLPPGFRFHPKDDELVCDYLMRRSLHDFNQPPLLFIHVDLNKCEPWEIPEMACVGGKDWYFYSQRDRKYATGMRTNRATATGYWKATGKDRAIVRKGKLVGMRKTLVFYEGRAPRGRKTDWVMHEFRLQGSFDTPNHSPKEEDWVLCRVFNKNTQGDKMVSCFEETASASLPPLIDDHRFIINQQVPCFSNFSPLKPPTGGSAPPTLAGLDSFCSSDQMVLRALLSQLNKIDGECSSESLFTDNGIPTTAWNC